MKKYLFTLCALVLLPSLSVLAQIESLENSFQKQINVPKVDVVVPTVVALPISDQILSNERFLVKEIESQKVESQKYVASYLYRTSSVDSPKPAIVTTHSVSGLEKMIDGDLKTDVEFVITDVQDSVSIILTFDEPITTSQLSVRLAQYVSLPTSVNITATDTGIPKFKTVVSEKRMTNQVIKFPETTANIFEITFKYAQPLIISELNFVDKNASQIVTQELRFLAQPDYSYQVYYDADRPVRQMFVEGGDLRTDDDVLLLPSQPVVQNRQYIPADVDEDGVRDEIDNCVRVANRDQTDIDGNDRGDACDDFDKDSVINSLDNCINQPNFGQLDEDNDGIGDACDDEESRFTERNKWVPWVGIGMAALVLLILFSLVARQTKSDSEEIVAEAED